MSIAEQEATQYFPTQYWPNHEPRKGYLGKECYLEGIKSSDIQEAYEQGRTAEPTEAEIEAAARVFFGNLHYPSASLDWDKAADSVKDNWRLKTRLALTAARKAVMA
jgi:hypothetical protein